ncbi:hypothetical protein DFH11DRAFT_1764188 [Phellopilus nigrolimitatus]|nr:hypothetical protein DFH11DRAFT_1764188 [Phellopilus nigrolimitatus]
MVMQKLAYSASPLVMSNQPNADYMKTNPKTTVPLEPFVRDGASDKTSANGLRRAGNQWSLNSSEPKIANSDLADEDGELGVSNGASDGTDGSTTPSKNVRDVLQLTMLPRELVSHVLSFLPFSSHFPWFKGIESSHSLGPALWQDLMKSTKI